MALTGPNLKGFFGGFSDGTYNFALPCCNGAGFGKVVRWALASFGQVQDDAGHNSASSDGLISQPCEVSKLNLKAASLNNHAAMLLLSVIQDKATSQKDYVAASDRINTSLAEEGLARRSNPGTVTTMPCGTSPGQPVGRGICFVDIAHLQVISTDPCDFTTIQAMNPSGEYCPDAPGVCQGKSCDPFFWESERLCGTAAKRAPRTPFGPPVFARPSVRLTTESKIFETNCDVATTESKIIETNCAVLMTESWIIETNCGVLMTDCEALTR